MSVWLIFPPKIDQITPFYSPKGDMGVMGFYLFIIICLFIYF